MSVSTALKTRAAEKNLQNQTDFKGVLRDLKKAWAKAISRVDAHSRNCGRCHQRNPRYRTMVAAGAILAAEPFIRCKTAEALHQAELNAIKAYLDAGGKLPAEMGRE